MAAAMTKSPLALARMALKIARASLPAYASLYSKKDFTQPQLFSILVLRQFFQTDYRGIVQYLGDWPSLQRVLGLKRLPHYTTLQKTQARMLKKGPWKACWTAFFDKPNASVS